MIATDTQLHIRFWNPAASRIFGGSSEVMIGQSIFSIVPEERRDLAKRLFLRALEQHDVTHLEFPYLDPSKNTIHLAVTISPILDHERNVQGISVYVRDVTRRIESEKTKAHENKMTALGAMASAIVHHFNNILCGPIAAIDEAKASHDPDKLRITLQRILPVLLRARRLTEALWIFAEGDRSIETTEEIITTIQRFMQSQESALSNRNIILRMNLGPIIARLPKKSILTILDNLVANASDAMPEGGILTIALLPGLNKNEIRLQVTDTGQGIPPEHLSRIFEPFFTTKSLCGEFGSTDHPGLGLAVIHGIIRDLGGSITFCSSPDSGTTFSVILPRHLAGHS